MSETRILQLRKRLVEMPEIESPHGFSVRSFRGTGDVGTWLGLRKAAFSRELVPVGDWDEADFEREFLGKWWWRPDCQWFVERSVGGELVPVGTVTLVRRGRQDASRPAIHWLAVLPAYRRRGIARLLVSLAERACWDAGEREVWVETHAQWRAAVRFYEALGYGAAD